MKIECSAGHKYDISTLAGRMQCGDRKPGQRCGMVLTYDRMYGSTYCRRILRETRADIPTNTQIRYLASKDIARETKPKKWTDLARELERENVRLQEALSDMVSVAESSGWENAEIKNARDVLAKK